MFGYVTMNRESLTETELNRFREVYCGVCVSLKQNYGIKGRITLSFDAAFLALLLNALYEPAEQKDKMRCPVHPARPRAYATSEMTDYAADMNMLLFYERALDNWNDDKNHAALMLSKVYKKQTQTVVARYPEKADAIRGELKKLSEIEKQRLNSIDAAAGCFGRLLGEIYAVKNDEWAPALRRMGCALGRFIYLMDAWDDTEKDMKSGSYNPFIAWKSEKDYEDRVYEALKMEIADCAMEFEKLPIVQDANILRNVLYSGVWTKYSRKRDVQERKGKDA